MVNRLNKTFFAPGAMLPRVTGAGSETSGNKNPYRIGPNHRQKVVMVAATPNILVVEDDRETRALIAKYLRTNACNVTTASD
jgi:PleD family two-component response regulator